ncbi:hypothetical protein FFLO_06589 [Filobasidium floriforme]|uniref:Uncharacterized protein n=1 Tax=Filobasidium floriforme TaxID=5210 RepID=A0A8K0JEM7_9TREE|nr:hypothetical protein FFLO_06589 [Filobasidium floriforme]
MRSFIIGALVTLASLGAVQAGLCPGHTEAAKTDPYATWRWATGTWSKAKGKERLNVANHIDCVSLCREEVGRTCFLKQKDWKLEHVVGFRMPGSNSFSGTSMKGGCDTDAAKALTGTKEQAITVRRFLYNFPTCIAIYSTRQLCTAMTPNGRTTWKLSLGLDSRVCCGRRGGIFSTAYIGRGIGSDCVGVLTFNGYEHIWDQVAVVASVGWRHHEFDRCKVFVFEKTLDLAKNSWNC